MDFLFWKSLFFVASLCKRQVWCCGRGSTTSLHPRGLGSVHLFRSGQADLQNQQWPLLHQYTQHPKPGKKMCWSSQLIKMLIWALVSAVMTNTSIQWGWKCSFVYVLAWLQTRSLFFLSLLQEELQSLSLGHLTLPILHLAETIANDLLDCRSLSDLYGLR